MFSKIFRKIKFVLLLLLSCLIFLNLSTSVLALGITPAKVELPYQPGSIHDVNLLIINNDGKDMAITFVAKGELANYLSFPNNTIRLRNGESYSLPVRITIPSGLSPGEHFAYVGPLQVAENSQEGISAVVSVLAKISVQVPYPEKYAEVELETKDIAIGDTEHFKVIVKNKGSKLINSITGKVTVCDSKDCTDIQTTSEKDLQPSSNIELFADWKPQKVGTYTAKATVYYDEKTAESTNKTFRVGDIDLDILDVKPTTLFSNEISTIGIVVKSNWNSPLNIYSEINLYDKNKLIASGGSKPEKLNAWETKEIQAYLDLKGVQPGNYSGIVSVYFENRTKEKKVIFEVLPQRAAGVNLTFEGALPTLLLLAIILIIILILRKKQRRENE